MIYYFRKLYWEGNILNYYDKKVINNKEIYIVEQHHHALLPWAEYRKTLIKAPILISLDHHTDTRSAFLHNSYDFKKDKPNEILRKQLIKYVDFKNETSILTAVTKLRNDEHIDLANKADIVSKSFIICYSQSNDSPYSYEMSKYQSSWHERIFNNISKPEPQRPFTYPESNIYIVENICSIGCEANPHNDDCLIPHFNQAIESDFLQHKLSIINEMKPGLVINNNIIEDYILDIDLDYFHTIASISPIDTSIFYNMIRNAKIITIATEPDFVDMWREDYKYDLNINSQILLEKLLTHIENALNQ